MPFLSAVLMSLLSAAPAERPALVVGAPDCPVRLDRASILTGSEGPPVLLYPATNATGEQLEQFTVIVFVFDAQGTLKARQTAPGRRTLNAHETKYSAMVLDGPAIAASDVIVVGVNGAQRVDSDTWWRADLQAAAIAAARPKQ